MGSSPGNDLGSISDAEWAELADTLPPGVLEAFRGTLGASVQEGTIPAGVIEQAMELDAGYVVRDHLTYLSARLTSALERVERGEKVYIAVTMPPRSGKTRTTSRTLPVLVLRKHPDWPVMLVSNDPTLATSWGREIRNLAKKHPDLGITIAPDAGAAGWWETIQGGSVMSRSIGGNITGSGARVLVVDDPFKGLADAHSEVSRNRVWNWYLGEAFPRLDRAGHLVVVVQTRWHEDDLIGRLLSPEHEGDPAQWEVIHFPAIAEESDVLGRAVGQPLLSPQVPDETPEQALTAWADIREAVGTYAWSALYQGSPAPSKGAIFDVDWWRFWTLNPNKATDDGKVVYLDPDTVGWDGKWVDSWDMAFKDTDASDYVVGQRWVRSGPNRFLVGQHRKRMAFPETLTVCGGWCEQPGTAPYGQFVHRRLVEDKANGTAIIAVLQERFSGMKPINPTQSKEARARAVTPEIESGHVYLPLPSDPGNEWVQDFLSEFRSFPVGAHDDQVDACTQALMDLRDPGVGSITIPGRTGTTLGSRSVTQTARTAGRSLGGGMGGRRLGGR